MKGLLMKWLLRLFKKEKQIETVALIQFEMKIFKLDQLEALAADCKLDKKQLFDWAMTLWELAVIERKKGKLIAIYDEYEETVQLVKIAPLDSIDFD